MEEEKEIKVSDETQYALDIINSNNSTQIKRLWILCSVLLLLFVGTNICWIAYISTFEEIEMTQTVSSDGAGDVAINGVGTGELNYYGSESDTDNQSETP